MAGALGIRLGGPATYRGVPGFKPLLGDPGVSIGPATVRRSVRLMRTASAMAVLLAWGFRLGAETRRRGGETPGFYPNHRREKAREAHSYERAGPAHVDCNRIGKDHTTSPDHYRDYGPRRTVIPSRRAVQVGGPSSRPARPRAPAHPRERDSMAGSARSGCPKWVRLSTIRGVRPPRSPAYTDCQDREDAAPDPPM
jgi:hypothetical protein